MQESAPGGRNNTENTRFTMAATLITILIGIVGLVFTYLQFHTTSVSYNIEAVNVVDSKNASGLKILDKEDNKVTGDVNAATFRIWNSGSAGITKEKIEPGIVTIFTPDNQSIVDYDVLTSLPELSQSDRWFTITQTYPNKLEIKFNTFSSSAEIKLSIVYTGNQKLEVSDIGDFADVPRLKKVQTEIERKSYATFLLRISAAAGLTSLLMAMYLLFSTPKAEPLTHTKGSISPHDQNSIMNKPNIIQISLVQAAPVIIGLFLSILAFMGWVVSKLTNLPPA